MEAAVAVAAAQGARGRGPIVLACAASNVAVDNMVEGLVRGGGGGGGGGQFKVVRRGRTHSGPPHLTRHLSRQ